MLPRQASGGMKSDLLPGDNSRKAFEGLCAILREAPSQERVAAAHGLAIHGAPAFGPLCEALRDKDAAVAIAAAEALGQIGDERAIEPLIDVLKSGLTGRSGWRQWWIGW